MAICASLEYRCSICLRRLSSVVVCLSLNGAATITPSGYPNATILPPKGTSIPRAATCFMATSLLSFRLVVGCVHIVDSSCLATRTHNSLCFIPFKSNTTIRMYVSWRGQALKLKCYIFGVIAPVVLK